MEIARPALMLAWIRTHPQGRQLALIPPELNGQGTLRDGLAGFRQKQSIDAIF
jgi:hypothetical protein